MASKDDKTSDGARRINIALLGASAGILSDSATTKKIDLRNGPLFLPKGENNIKSGYNRSSGGGPSGMPSAPAISSGKKTSAPSKSRPSNLEINGVVGLHWIYYYGLCKSYSSLPVL